MDLINQKIRDAVSACGCKVKSVSIAHLPEVREAVGNLVRQGHIDTKLSENWHFYLPNNTDMPGAKTIIITAMAEPISRFTFKYRQGTYYADVPPTYIATGDEKNIEGVLKNALNPLGYRISKARLPIKTLAVRSGLAMYGKNNLVYVSGFGSFCRLTAFFSDAPCEEDDWRPVEAMKTCDTCTLCRENCPMGSITTDRFLVHAEKCLTRFNENEPDLPDWINPDWHSALIGCMHCQSVCPVDRPYLNNIEMGPVFSEEETMQILGKTPIGELSPQTRQKLDVLIVEEIYPVMARNLAAIIKKHQAA